MAHRPSQRRNLAAPETNPPLTGSAPAKHPHPRPTTTFIATPSHHPTPNPDLIQACKPSSLAKHFSSLNLSHRAPTPHKQSQTKHPLLVDTRLQAKAMTTSAILDSSKSLLLKPNTHNTKLAPKFGKKSTMPAKRPYKEKPQKPNLELENRKVHGLMKNEKKGNSNRSLVEDIKIENSRNHLVEEHDVSKRVSFSLAPSMGRRRSLCGSQIDLGDVFAINGAKMVSADMAPFMQIHAVDCARKAFDSMEKFTSKTLALSLKKEFDGVYGPAWHCIVGTSFGSFVTHSVGGFLYFSIDQKLYILLFKTTVQKAE
ncbi:uncharacterized protein LOC133303036 [Gastrolobium bilobum]|uniref:uncharacterized protein LOC133303036 n=1 Tax=Gastrolobium bilobum TaxID=150636 RepID=UPI002AB15E93|nr:uncharacterized protein LOC133303036 [Gastrolobium bilobum]